jgi:hypothetical protein
MTTPADNPDAEKDETTPLFVFKTPFGFFTAADDLPAQARGFLTELVDNPGLPPLMREALAAALSSPVAAETTEAEQPSHGPHGPGCTCTEDHRDRVWQILDLAFPRDPHLWQAMEALFELSAQNPVDLDEDERRAALETAVLHLERHVSLTTPESPTEQLISRFRREMGEL